jgi:hypothetical protein
MRIFAIFFVLLMCTACVAPGYRTGGSQVTDGAPVQLQPHTAYLLVRTKVAEGSSAVEILFVRTLSPEELQTAVDLRQKDPEASQKPNVYTLWSDDPYTEINGERTYLVAVDPGTYIIGGFAYGGMMGTCMCMGTVQFGAKEGVITDLGYLLTAREDKPIKVVELAGYERDAGGDVASMAMTVRLPSSSMPVPETLQSLPRTNANYRAFGPFPNYFASMIDRMAPVPDVLDYDKNGKIIDLKVRATALAVPSNPVASTAAAQ